MPGHSTLRLWQKDLPISPFLAQSELRGKGLEAASPQQSFCSFQRLNMNIQPGLYQDMGGLIL